MDKSRTDNASVPGQLGMAGAPDERASTRSGRAYGAKPGILRNTLTVASNARDRVSAAVDASVCEDRDANETIGVASNEATLGDLGFSRIFDESVISASRTARDRDASMMSSTILPNATHSEDRAAAARIDGLENQLKSMVGAIQSLVARLDAKDEAPREDTRGQEPRRVGTDTSRSAEEWRRYRERQRYRSSESLATADDARSVASVASVETRERVRERCDLEEAYEPTERDWRSDRRTLRVPRGDDRESCGYASRSSVRPNPYEDLRFAGKGDRQHPIRFLEEFLRIADHERLNENDRLYYLRYCLSGRAREWFENQEFLEFGEAAIRFRAKYWGHYEQSAFRDQLRSGFYRPQGGRSMAEHAEKLARDARFLTPTFTETELVEALARQFDTDTLDRLRVEGVATVSELCHRLNIIERREEDRIQARARRRLWEFEEEERRKLHANKAKRERDHSPEREYETEKYSKEYRDYGRKEARSPYEEESRNGGITREYRPKWKARTYRNREYDRGSTARKSDRNKDSDRVDNDQNPTDKARSPESRKNKDRYDKRDGSKVREKDDGAKKANDSDTRGEPSRSRDRSRENRKRDVISTIRVDEIPRINAIQRDESIKNDKTLPMVDVRIRTNDRDSGPTVEALLDTGSEMSTISSNVVKRIERDEKIATSVKIDKIQILGAFGKKGVWTNEKVQLTVKPIEPEGNTREYIHEFFVIKNLYVPIILGFDFLKKYNIGIKCGEAKPIVVSSKFQNTSNETHVGIANVAKEKHTTLSRDKFVNTHVEAKNKKMAGEKRMAGERNWVTTQIPPKNNPTQRNTIVDQSSEIDDSNLRILDRKGSSFLSFVSDKEEEEKLRRKRNQLLDQIETLKQEERKIREMRIRRLKKQIAEYRNTISQYEKNIRSWTEQDLAIDKLQTVKQTFCNKNATPDVRATTRKKRHSTSDKKHLTTATHAATSPPPQRACGGDHSPVPSDRSSPGGRVQLHSAAWREATADRSAGARKKRACGGARRHKPSTSTEKEARLDQRLRQPPLTQKGVADGGVDGLTKQTYPTKPERTTPKSSKPDGSIIRPNEPVRLKEGRSEPKERRTSSPEPSKRKTRLSEPMGEKPRPNEPVGSRTLSSEPDELKASSSKPVRMKTQSTEPVTSSVTSNERSNAPSSEPGGVAPTEPENWRKPDRTNRTERRPDWRIYHRRSYRGRTDGEAIRAVPEAVNVP